MSDFDYRPAAISWRHNRLVQLVTRALILWSLATVVVCGMVKHTYAHRLSSDHLNALSRILRAACMQSMRSRVRSQDHDEAVTVAAESLAWRCRMAIRGAWRFCLNQADKQQAVVASIKTAVGTLLDQLPGFRKLTLQPAPCTLLTTRLRC